MGSLNKMCIEIKFFLKSIIYALELGYLPFLRRQGKFNKVLLKFVKVNKIKEF